MTERDTPGQRTPGQRTSGQPTSGPRTSALPIGRLHGIPIRLDWTLPIVFWLLTWSLAQNLLADDQDATAATWLVGAVAAALFLSSLLAHEMGHSLVAQRHGVEVISITLWLLGGIAQLGNDAPDARAELRIAAAGPATSGGLAVGFGALAGVASVLGAPDIVALALAWLGAINLMLALFNLLPGAPLDGGRILRAWYWKRSGDRLDSQRRAARAGHRVGIGLIAVGILEFTLGAGLSGLWLAFIGWFIIGAARAEELDAVLRHDLAGIRMRDVMTPDPVTVDDATTIDELLDSFLRHHRSAYPVLHAGRLAGLVTLTEVRTLPADRRITATVADVMVPVADCRVARPDDALLDVLRADGRPTRILVVDGVPTDPAGGAAGLVGIVTPTDIARVIEVTQVAAR